MSSPSSNETIPRTVSSYGRETGRAGTESGEISVRWVQNTQRSLNDSDQSFMVPEKVTTRPFGRR